VNGTIGTKSAASSSWLHRLTGDINGVFMSIAVVAAVLFALAPALTNSQVSTILEHSTDDVNAATGCPKCGLLHDAYSGWGRIDVAKAVAALTAGPLPARDQFETNDDAGTPKAGTPRFFSCQA